MTAVRSCPICSAHDGQLVVNSVQDPKLISQKDLSELFVGLRANQSFFRYIRCAKCQLCYNNEYFSQRSLGELYSSMPPNLVFDEEHNVKETHKNYSDYIIKNQDLSQSLIELGADSGFVTERVIKEFGINKGTIVEPNIEVRPILESIVKGKDFEIVSDLSESELNMQYDLFIAVHVLDHLLDPCNDLLKISKSMKSGGKAFIVVHNQKSLLAKILGNKWPPYCLQHPQIFDRKSINLLLLKVGFHQIQISRTKNKVSIKNLVSMLFQILRLPKFILKVIPDLSIDLYLGNIIVSAEKI
jgi:hypothetical protein